MHCLHCLPHMCNSAFLFPHIITWMVPRLDWSISLPLGAVAIERCYLYWISSGTCTPYNVPCMVVVVQRGYHGWVSITSTAGPPAFYTQYPAAFLPLVLGRPTCSILVTWLWGRSGNHSFVCSLISCLQLGFMSWNCLAFLSAVSWLAAIPQAALHLVQLIK